MAFKLPLDIELNEIAASGSVPRLLLHCCCAPCASYALEYLSGFFRIGVLFYNPNIRPREEFDKRAMQFDKLLSMAPLHGRAELIAAPYDDAEFDSVAANYPDEPEGGRRCRECFELRLGKTAALAEAGGYDYFTTTLTVSPHKDAAVINGIGGALAERRGVRFLHADFKKRDGFKQSIELSKRYGLYRQTYCGCGLPVRRAGGS